LVRLHEGESQVLQDVASTTEPTATVRELAEEHASVPGGLLPLLHAIQNRLRHIPDTAVPVVAEALGLSRAEVHGVISFYHLFRREPPGEKILYLCRAEACQSMGARSLEAHAKAKLAIDFHGTTVDGRYSLEPIYCLGNCACAPAVMIDQAVYGRVDTKRLDELLEES
jgi:formate dehydrogenase subunit gamma